MKVREQRHLLILVGIALCALGAAIGIFVTSEKPDGLERVLLDLKVDVEGSKTQDTRETDEPKTRGALRAAAGALVTAGVLIGVARLFRARRSKEEGHASRRDR